jgi:hypothetical protein
MEISILSATYYTTKEIIISVLHKIGRNIGRHLGESLRFIQKIVMNEILCRLK